jgi:hypothetical protein
MSPLTRSRWLFGPRLDLAVFLGSALLAFALLGVGALAGALDRGTPDWVWVPAVLLVDVAHVWATGFRVYFDKAELRRRPVLYALVPVLGFASSVTLLAIAGSAVFWRCLAYLAIFHFVRQQYGWVALYRAKCRETDRAGQWLDAATIYSATLYPLLYWHTHLPRHFDWFVPGDVFALPAFLDALARPLYVALLSAYALRSALQWRRGEGNLGKDVIVVTTAACWYVGIVALDSDYAFTVTNVLIHGIPYFALVYVTRRATQAAVAPASAAGSRLGRVASFLGLLWFIAYVEEMLWDRAIWQDHGWLFGSPWAVGDHARTVLVALLALPQLTHYVLDGFVWRRRYNPELARVFEPEPLRTVTP